MKNNIITIEDVKRDEFNSFVFETDTVEKFMSFFMLLLEVAYKLEIISLQERDSISNYLLTAFSKKANGNAILISNIMYAYSWYLQSMNKWDALTELRNLTSLSSAEQSLQNCDKQVKKFVTRNSLFLQYAMNDVVKLDNPQFGVVSKEFDSLLQDVKRYDIDENVDLRSCHIPVLPIDYISLNNRVKYPNYFAKLEDGVKSFFYDVKILRKLSGKDFFAYNYKLKAKADEKDDLRFKKLEEKYSQKLEALEAKYQEEMDAAIQFENSLDKMSESKRMSSYTRSSAKHDPLGITDNYKKQKDKLMESWAKEEEKLRDREDSAEEKIEKDAIFLKTDLPSTEVIIKEYAFYYMLYNGLCEAPNPKKINSFIQDISLKTAIEIIIKISNEIGLDEAEIEYLKAVSTQ